jgi:hypothetical protein
MERRTSGLSTNGSRPSVFRASASTHSVDSAALQSEIAKKYNLGNNPSRRNLNPNSRNNRNGGSSDSSSLVSQSRITSAQSVCACCNASVGPSDQVCSSCGYYLFSIVVEPQTLAQRRGLVPQVAKIEPLSPADWSAIELSISVRSNPDSCCPICMEGFNQGSEVLLSCSHLFHRACLRSFENHVKDSLAMSCPLCRCRVPTILCVRVRFIGLIAPSY